MRKLMFLFAALVALCAMSPLAYAADSSAVSVAEESSVSATSEETQIAYLTEGAYLYTAPDNSADVYTTAPTSYNKSITVSETTDDGWVKFLYSYSYGFLNMKTGYVWLYAAPEDVIWEEEDANTVTDVLNNYADVFRTVCLVFCSVGLIFVALSFMGMETKLIGLGLMGSGACLGIISVLLHAWF